MVKKSEYRTIICQASDKRQKVTSKIREKKTYLKTVFKKPNILKIISKTKKIKMTKIHSLRIKIKGPGLIFKLSYRDRPGPCKPDLQYFEFKKEPQSDLQVN